MFGVRVLHYTDNDKGHGWENYICMCRTIEGAGERERARETEMNRDSKREKERTIERERAS